MKLTEAHTDINVERTVNYVTSVLSSLVDAPEKQYDDFFRKVPRVRNLNHVKKVLQEIVDTQSEPLILLAELIQKYFLNHEKYKEIERYLTNKYPFYYGQEVADHEDVFSDALMCYAVFDDEIEPMKNDNIRCGPLRPNQYRKPAPVYDPEHLDG